MSNFVVEKSNKNKSKVIIDLVLKSEVNEYRFVSFEVADSGKILWNSGEYVVSSVNIIKLTNSFIANRRDILRHSMSSCISRMKLF